MVRSPIAIVLGLASACAQAHNPGAAGPAAGGKAELRAAEKRGREVVQEGYRSLRRGDPDGFHALAGPEIVALGPAAGDRFESRTDLLVELARALPPRKKHRVTSHDLRVVSSPSGKSAWAADRLEIDGAPYRMTAVLAEIDELWVVVAIQLSRPGSRTPAPPSPPATLSAAADPRAADAVRLFREGTEAPDRLVDQLGDDKDAVAIGPGARETARGIKAIRKQWKKRPPSAPPEGVHAGAAPDGSLVWIAANLVVDGVPLRAFYVYARGADGWRLVAAHEALAPPR